MGTPGSNGPDRITVNTYDAANELTQVTTGALSTNQIAYATTTYGNNGEVLTVKDAANNLTTLVYDGYDRLSQVQFPLPTTGSNASNPSDYEAYAYDANGNLTSKRLRSGSTVTLTYDNLNRLTQEQFPSGTSQPVYYAYDLLNRVLMVSNVSASGPGIAYAYDALGRATRMTQNGRTLSYAYDAAGNRTALTWPETTNALTANYTYDGLNNVAQIQQNGATSGAGLLAAYTYDGAGRRSAISRAGGAGLATAYAYDAISRLSTLTQTLSGSAGTTFTYGYNPASQVISRTDSNGGYSVLPSSLAFAYTANGLNQYSSVTGQTLTLSSGPQASLAYDPLGRIQSETASGSTSNFLYDGAFLAEEYDPAGNTLARYVPGPGLDEPITVYGGSGLTANWYASDQEGSIIATADASANLIASYDYGPYGEPLTSGGAPSWGGSRYRYTGQIEIPGAQAYFYKARMYDPGNGRFFQTDPAGFGGGINIYAYAVNDPINGWDPWGLVAEDPGPPLQCIACTYTQSTSVTPIDITPSSPTPDPPQPNGSDQLALESTGGGLGDMNTSPAATAVAALVAIASKSTPVAPLLVLASNLGSSPQSGQRTTCTGVATFTAVGPNQAHADGALYSQYPAQAGGSIRGGTFGTVAVQNGFLGLSTRQLRTYGTQIFITPGNQGLISQYGGPTGPLSVSDYGDANVQANNGLAFDIYRFPTTSDALAFGRRTMNVTISFPTASGGHC